MLQHFQHFQHFSEMVEFLISLQMACTGRELAPERPIKSSRRS